MAGIGERVFKLRLEQGLSQDCLAKRAGIAQSFLSSIERGGKSPTLRTLRKLTKALDVPLEELVSGLEEDERE